MQTQQTAFDWLAAFITIGALAIGLISMAVGWVSRHWPTADRRPTTAEPAPAGRRVMSRPASMRRPKRRGVVSIPVSRYGMAAGGMDARAAAPEAAAPDMDAENAGMPRLSRMISDADLIAFLAVLRGPGGKYRYSANAIFGFVGGDRNTVLARIKEIRDGPKPVYPPRTPEQQQLRSELGLG